MSATDDSPGHHVLSRTPSFAPDSASRAGRGLHRADSDPDRRHPADSRRARSHRHRADRHGQDGGVHPADPDQAGRSIQNGQRRGPRALVIAPTRELVVQIEENVRAYAKHLPLRVATVFGGVGEQPQIARCAPAWISSSLPRDGCWI